MGMDHNGNGNGKNSGPFDLRNQASTTSTSMGLLDVPQGKRLDARLDVERAVDSRIVADAQGTRVTDDPHPAFPKPPKPERHWGRRIVISLMIAAIVGAGLRWGVPAVKEALDTVSTDDAFVQGHVTYVSPRVEGLVTEVLVDQEDRVEPGDLLVKLDREPFDVAVAQARLRSKKPRPMSRNRGLKRVPRSPGARRLLSTEKRPGNPATPDRHAERRVCHAQKQASEPGAGAKQSRARREAAAERRHQQGRV